MGHALSHQQPRRRRQQHRAQSASSRLRTSFLEAPAPRPRRYFPERSVRRLASAHLLRIGTGMASLRLTGPSARARLRQQAAVTLGPWSGAQHGAGEMATCVGSARCPNGARVRMRGLSLARTDACACMRSFVPDSNVRMPNPTRHGMVLLYAAAAGLVVHGKHDARVLDEDMEKLAAKPKYKDMRAHTNTHARTHARARTHT